MTVCDWTFPRSPSRDKKGEHEHLSTPNGAEGRITANRAGRRTRTEPSTMAEPQEDHEDDGEVRPRCLPLVALFPRA